MKISSLKSFACLRALPVCESAPPVASQGDSMTVGLRDSRPELLAQLEGLRPPPPLRAGATVHIDALNYHIEDYLKKHPQQMQALKDQLMQSLGAGSSHVCIDTSPLFPTLLCEAAWRELKSIRSRDRADGANGSTPPRQIRLPAWAGWLEGLKAELRVQLQVPRSGRGVRGELRDETQGKGISWHIDFSDLSATTALKGPSTEFAPSVKNLPVHRIGEEDKIPDCAIETAQRGHTLLFRGRLVPNPLVHRAPRGAAERLVFVN